MSDCAEKEKYSLLPHLTEMLILLLLCLPSSLTAGELSEPSISCAECISEMTSLGELGLYWPKPADEWEAEKRAARGYRPRQEELAGPDVAALDFRGPPGDR